MCILSWTRSKNGNSNTTYEYDSKNPHKYNNDDAPFWLAKGQSDNVEDSEWYSRLCLTCENYSGIKALFR